MIYTSYFWQLKNFPSNFEPICIARWKPKWYNGKVLLSLAPSSSLLNWWRNTPQDNRAKKIYEQWYKNEVLSIYNPRAIERIIKHMSGNKVPVLVCFEGTGFCHRHLISKWFNEHGIKCEEWSK